MEYAHQSTGGSGGGPAPFLLKTYDMVDDSTTNEIVSWSDSSDASFVVWNPPEFAARLLPIYFKHNNFSSFIRQLNTYGFRKIDPERWEFANEDFIRGQKHLLKNIHRRKPIHSHSHPPQSGLADAERAAMEDEIDRLTRERAAMQADLQRFRQHQPTLRIQLDALDDRLQSMEVRQQRMIEFLNRALENPTFVKALANAADDPFAVHKKRRVPDVDARLRRDFCDKLKLELSPAMSDEDLVLTSCHSSNVAESPHGKQQLECGDASNTKIECLSLAPETLDLTDTCASCSPRKNALFDKDMDEEREGFIECQLSLALASSSLQINRTSSPTSADLPLMDQAVGHGSEPTASNRGEMDPCGTVKDPVQTSSYHEAPSSTQKLAPAAPQGRVNDLFWEQFLTERPGSSDTEEASSSMHANPTEELQYEKNKVGNVPSRPTRKDMEQLTL